MPQKRVVVVGKRFAATGGGLVCLLSDDNYYRTKWFYTILKSSTFSSDKYTLTHPILIGTRRYYLLEYLAQMHSSDPSASSSSSPATSSSLPINPGHTQPTTTSNSGAHRKKKPSHITKSSCASCVTATETQLRNGEIITPFNQIKLPSRRVSGRTGLAVGEQKRTPDALSNNKKTPLSVARNIRHRVPVTN